MMEANQINHFLLSSTDSNNSSISGDLERESQLCPICRRSFATSLLLATHSLTHTQPHDAFRRGVNVLRLNHVTPFDGMVRDYELTSDEKITDIAAWLTAQLDLLHQAFSPLLREFVVRGMLYVQAVFVRIDPETGRVVERITPFIPSLRSSQICDLNVWLAEHTRGLQATLEKFTTEGSGWILDGVERAIFKLNLSLNYSGSGFFELPSKLKNKKAVINVECSENCFKYSLLSILHYTDVKRNRERVTAYSKWENELDFGEVDINNVDIARDVAKIENLNNLKINVHVWEKNELKGICYNKRSNLATKTINILLVINSKGERHYCGISSLGRLYHHTKNTNCTYLCERCIRSFKTREALETHFKWCVKGKAQIESMPKIKEYSHKSFGHELSPLRVIYADAECYIEPETKAHLPAAIGFYEVMHLHHRNNQNKIKINTFVGDNCISNFIDKLEVIIKSQFEKSVEMRQAIRMTPLDQIEFNKSTSCPRCNKKFSDKIKKVRDHCHISGQYRGPLCSECNLRLQLKRQVLPVIFHNLKNYDLHLLIKNGLGKKQGWQFSVIAQSAQKFMTLKARVPVGYSQTGRQIYNEIVFLDSFQFMSSSLASLVKNLNSFPLTKNLCQEYPQLTDDLIRSKGIFPYSYFDSLDKLKETQLPPRSAFTNDLTGEGCSADNYSHALKAWNLFNCNSFGDYMLAYLKLDIVLLADVFEEFRKMSMEQDGLEPVHFVSLPGLSFMSAFKMTHETIHLLQDADLYSFFERGIRGGLTFVNRHRSRNGIFQVNNKTQKKIIMYIDENNLYGKALSEPLPHSNFHDLTSEEIEQLFPSSDSILKINKKDEIGYVFEVDLDYPPSIHDKTEDFPFAPEQGEVGEDMLSPFMKQLFCSVQQERGNKNKYKPCRKLLLTQFDKQNYVIHYALLQFFLQEGLVLKKIHRVVSFKQKTFLEPYIRFNSERRASAQNAFEKDFYKLKNNSLFGKCMEDVRKRQNYKLVNDEVQMDKLIKSPFFIDRDIITEDIVGVKMMKPKVVLDKPIYIGQAVLDYSKLTMYTLFYKTLKQCPLINNLTLLGGDTDSFFLELTVDEHITQNDVLDNLKEHVDFSNYPPSHPLFSSKNKAKLGCFKDECAGRTISEIIMLKPKMYSIKLEDEEDGIKRAKGISRAIVKNMRHEEYLNTYNQHKETYVNMTILKSTEHTIHTTTFRKRALSCLEDKRCWIDSNDSLPHGNYNISFQSRKRPRISLPASGDVET